jgi:hypothetical protein
MINFLPNPDGLVSLFFMELFCLIIIQFFSMQFLYVCSIRTTVVCHLVAILCFFYQHYSNYNETQMIIQI